MENSREVHLRYELPKFRRDKEWLHKLASFHNTSDSLFRSLKRFTVADFQKKFRKCNPSDYGYRSFDHLFAFRGCLSEGEYYTYDERYAIEIKACIVAKHLVKFTPKEFYCYFREIFVARNVLKKNCGFDSVEALLSSIPGLISAGWNQYQIGSGSDLQTRPKSAPKRVSVGHSTETIPRSLEIRRYELPKFGRDKETIEYITRCHNSVDEYFRSQRQFTIAKFTSGGFSKSNIEKWGYCSFDHLFVMRGCVHDGVFYNYDENTAIQRKAHILAVNLRKFCYKRFCYNFKKVFTAEEILSPGCGFDSVEALLSSIPGLISTGGEQYEVLRDADRQLQTEKENLDQRRGKRQSCALGSSKCQDGPPLKRSKIVADCSMEEADFPKSSSCGLAKKCKSKGEEEILKVVMKKNDEKKKRRRYVRRIKAVKTIRSSSGSTSASVSTNKKKMVVKKKQKAAHSESSCNQSLESADVSKRIEEGENCEAMQLQLKKMEERLKEMELKLKKGAKLGKKRPVKKRRSSAASPKIRGAPHPKVKEEVTNYVESVEGSPSIPGAINPSEVAGEETAQSQWRNEQTLVSIGQMQQGPPGGYGSHGPPMFPGFVLPPMPLFQPCSTTVVMSNSTPLSSVIYPSPSNTLGIPRESSGPATASEEVHDTHATGRQLQSLTAHQGFVPGFVPGQIHGFGPFAPPPMVACFPPPVNHSPSQILGQVMSSVVASALERSSDPRELTNQLFDAIFGKERRQ